MRADLHVNLRGCTTPRTLSAARGAQWLSDPLGYKKKHSILDYAILCGVVCHDIIHDASLYTIACYILQEFAILYYSILWHSVAV